MEELMRTNDVGTISFVEALLSEAGIIHFVADTNMSVLEGSIGVLPRRVMVEADRYATAAKLLTDAGIDPGLITQSR